MLFETAARPWELCHPAAVLALRKCLSPSGKRHASPKVKLVGPSRECGKLYVLSGSWCVQLSGPVSGGSRSGTFRGFTNAEAGLVEVLQTLNDEVDGSPVRLG